MTESTIQESASRNTAVAGRTVVDPAEWTGKDIEVNTDWIYFLSDEEIKDLRAMAQQVREKFGDDPNSLLATKKEDFNLGVFANQVQQIGDQIKNGLGFALVRGLPVEDMDVLEAATIYWGLGRHLGTAVSNNLVGDMLCPIMDFGKDINAANSRGYETSATLDYHTDQSDVVSLLCLQVSKSGGESKIASSVAVYNTMLKRHPEMVEALMKPVCWSLHGQVDEGQKNYYESPIFNFLDGKLCTSFGAQHIRKGHELPEVQDLTRLQAEAITKVDEISEELHYSMVLELGDIQLVNNTTVTHSREAFDDWPELERRRRLLRMWLEVPGLRPLTPFLKNWRGGIKAEDASERIELKLGVAVDAG